MAEEFPDDENGDVLRRMQKDGDDFTKARDIDFSVIFPNESSAKQFADHFGKAGFKVAIEEWEGDRELPWDVTVTRHMYPTHSEITQIENALEGVAAPLGGANDGWGCMRQSVLH